MDVPWTARLALCLVGAEPDVGSGAATGDVLATLERAGWDAAAVRGHAADRRAAGQPWPHPVPVTWLREYGPARWAATVADLVRRLELEADTAAPSPRRPLSSDERRLLADVPPHHGS